MNPRLTNKEVISEVAFRAHLRYEDLDAAFKALRDVAEESIMAGVGLPVPYLATITYKDMPARDNVEHFNIVKQEKSVIPHLDAYRLVKIRFSQGLAQKIREATTVKSGDENGKTN